MKKVFVVLLTVISSFAFAQKKATQEYSKVKRNSCINGKGYQLVLKEVLADSRCPEGVTCVWAGEVSAVVSVYKDSEWVENKTLVFSGKNDNINMQWIVQYLNENQKTINIISIEPHPKAGKLIKPKDYYLQIGYLKYN